MRQKALLVWTLALPMAASLPTLATRTAGLVKRDGFLPLYWDAAQGRAYLEVRPGQEFIHQVTLTSGLGSNSVGLDRGQAGSTRVVAFERRGPKVMLIQRNTSFIAEGSPAERAAVEASFARSVLQGFKVEAEDGDRVLVDATPFLLSDAHEIGARLEGTGQGNYSLDESRSSLIPELLKAFPRNTEAEAELTFTSSRPGPEVQKVAAEPKAITLRVRHSFVALPDPGYRPRAFDPRVNTMSVQVADYASPFTGPLERRWILRHRLEKRDPAATVSEPKQPIVYYLDPATPEPMRSALLEGASWWAPAFEAAGFRNAFQVKLLPLDADPLDLRYNVIHWVHRATRGWSMGNAVCDPRTGEILKGVVLLGSLRIRQDYLIGTGLVSPWAGGPETWAGADAGQLALDRLKQLAAHEVGHTLGFEHNFAASNLDRSSVMDYPAPRIAITSEGKLDFREAYAKGIGRFDRWAVAYTYSQFAPGIDEARELAQVLASGSDLRFVKDDDARDPGTAHAFASVWDDGTDPVAQLRHEMDVRRIGLKHFGAASQPEGEPRSLLEARLLPLYLHHRYQAEAAAKLIGGLDFNYSVRQGSASLPATPRAVIAGARQREALHVLLECLDPAFLALPRELLPLLSPRASGFESGIPEYFPNRTGVGFDPLAAAGTAADIVVSTLLHPSRAARLVQQHAEASDRPGLGEVILALLDRAFPAVPASNPWLAAHARETQRVVVTRLESLAGYASAEEVRAIAEMHMRELADRLEAHPGKGDEGAHRRYLRNQLLRSLNRPGMTLAATPLVAVPPGPPIGD